MMTTGQNQSQEQSTTNKREGLVKDFLDSYFACRASKIPASSILAGGRWLREEKNTYEIIEDLADMIPLEMHEVNDYMLKRGFAKVLQLDGSLKWLIFRDVDSLCGVTNR